VTDDYELLDAGGGRRLERFGRHLVDRPAPAASDPARDQAAWAAATLRFDRPGESRRGGWRPDDVAPWAVSLGPFRLELRPASGGQVGVFPEHLSLAGWVAARTEASRAADSATPRNAAVLNLFAYTGALSLVAARAGAAVAHVDASRPAVAWARRNATLNGLDGCPIRWLVDDAARFARHEAARGRRYDGIVLDPPSYGHGGTGDWRLTEDLPALLETAVGLLDGPAPFVLLTAHARDLGADALAVTLAVALERNGREPTAIETGRLELEARSGARLPAGVFARWPR
jgi:23S rRNA (cytosine1962-C5)-methyltransferase